jgi:gluconate 2-dehydrogenase gamma chain
MHGSAPTRREFMASAAGMLGGGWLWLNLPAIATISACARDAAQRDEAFSTLNRAEGRAMRAFASRILPSEPGSPGAEEAGAAWFTDAVLGGPLQDMAEPVRAGLADLDERARAEHGTVFAELGAAQQDAIIGAVDATPFFALGRMLVVMGTFSDPAWGGNRDHVGFTLLGIEHAPAYTPPFGWYDAEHARTNGGAA